MIRARSEKDIEYRRNTILEAAETLFSENDYNKITMDTVAKTVQLTKSTLYQYFISKDEILLTIIEKNLANGNHLYQEAIMKCKDPICQLKAIAEVTYNNNKANKHLHAIYLKIRPLKIMDKANPEMGQSLKDKLNYRTQGTKVIISYGIKIQAFRSDKPVDFLVDYFLVSLSNLVDHCIQMYNNCDHPKLADQYFNEYVDMIIDSLKIQNNLSA